MQTLVSVVVPYLNRVDCLPRTLHSIYNQTYRPLEVILVDNGSSDASPSICTAFAREHADPDFVVKLLRHNRRGASAARNAGLRQVTGHYVSFFDSDDEMSPDFIAVTMRVTAATT